MFCERMENNLFVFLYKRKEMCNNSESPYIYTLVVNHPSDG